MAYFGAGCFWGVQSLFQKLDGVDKVFTGYMGGDIKDPKYTDICTGITNHAEVVSIEYDSNIISFEQLVDYFFRLHDPTTLNQDGPNRGTQYRSVIFSDDEIEKEIIKNVINKIRPRYSDPIVTQISAMATFWKAEELHQDYYTKKYQGLDGPICHFLRKF